MARELPPPFKLTATAKAHVAAQLAAHPQALGLRIGLKTAGCSGNKYVFGLAEAQNPTDRVAMVDGIRVFMEPMAEMQLLGATLDVVASGLNKTLDFVSNPNEAARCGCGESVTFKPQP